MKRCHLQVSGYVTRQLHKILGEKVTSSTPCDCYWNVVHALYKRGLFGQPRPAVEERTFALYCESIRHFYDLMGLSQGISPLSFESVIAGYSGTKREHYRQSYEMFKQYGLPRVYFHVMAKWGERTDRPRVIIFQVCRYEGTEFRFPILYEQRWRYRVGKALKSLRNRCGVPLVSDGRTLQEQCSDVHAIFEAHPGWISLGMDAHHFDGSEGDCASYERSYFLWLARDRLLRRIINSQERAVMKNRGFKCVLSNGGRQSGTAGTSVGNKLVMLAAVRAVLLSFDIDDWALYCAGDDILVFFDPIYLSRFTPEKFSDLGLDVDVDNVARRPQDVVFCRARPFRTSRGDVMLKDPVSAIKSCFALTRHFRDRTIFRDYLATLRVGYYNLWCPHEEVPVYGVLARIFPAGGVVRPRLLGDSGLEWQMSIGPENSVREYREPTREARLKFFDVTGWSPSTQKKVEDLLFLVSY